MNAPSLADAKVNTASSIVNCSRDAQFNPHLRRAVDGRGVPNQEMKMRAHGRENENALIDTATRGVHRHGTHTRRRGVLKRDAMATCLRTLIVATRRDGQEASASMQH